MDISHQAVESHYFPISVGLRSQALKLNFVTPETRGLFLKPTLSLKKVMQIFEHRFTMSQPKPVFQKAHIGETISLIYSPFYMEDKIYDAVLNEPVTSELPDDLDTTLFSGVRPDWRTHFIPTLCPGCGWDLYGQRDALVLNCKNCNSAWRPAGNGFKKLKFACIPEKEDNILYMPFWRIKADISGITLDSYADLVKIANLPKAVQKNWNDIKFCFWTLAFKLRPLNFIRLASNITLLQPQEKLVEELPDARLYPVTLPIEEALECLSINLASLMKPQKDLFPKLKDITITPKSFLLVYIPFIEKHHDFIQPKLNLTINKKRLALASNL